MVSLYGLDPKTLNPKEFLTLEADGGIDPSLQEYICWPAGHDSLKMSFSSVEL